MSSLRPLSWVRGADVRFGKACGNRGPILIFPVNSQHDSRPITIRRGRFPSAVKADLAVLHTRSTSNGSDIGNCGPPQPNKNGGLARKASTYRVASNDRSGKSAGA